MRVTGILLIVTLALLAVCQAKPGGGYQCKFDHQRWRSDGTACEDNCQNYGVEGKICTMNLVQGCFCMKPYIFRDGQRGPCVRPENCPQ